MERFVDIFTVIGNITRGPVMIFGLFAVGIYLTFRLKFIQFRYIRKALSLICGKHDDSKKTGEITYFQALCTAFTTVSGAGNIVGVAMAISIGGPGAVFWMWMAVFFYMSIEFANGLLAVKYRKTMPDGSIRGGPMYYLQYGLKCKWLAVIYAIFAIVTSFAIGNIIQVKTVAEPLESGFGIPKVVTGIIFGLLLWGVIAGGIKRIGQVTSTLVPFISIVYVIGSIIIIYLNLAYFPWVFRQIFTHIFHPTSAIGGFTGAVALQTIRMGVGSGIIANSAGLSGSSIAHAAAKTDEPALQGMVAMAGLLFNLIICTLTALVIIITGAWQTGLTGAELIAWAFSREMPRMGNFVISLGLSFFAFLAVIGWSYYGEQAISYLFGEKIIRFYRWLFVLALPIGASVKLSFIWVMANMANGLMILPSLIGILSLSGVIFVALRDYMKHDSSKKAPEGQSI